MLPTDIIHDSPRVQAYDEENAEIACQDTVDLLEEERELLLQRSAIYQQGLRRYHSRKIKHRSFKECDLVLRRVQEREHKLAPIWEGPFVISKAMKNGSYYVVDIRDDEKDPKKKDRKRKRNIDVELEETNRAWSIQQLRPFYT